MKNWLGVTVALVLAVFVQRAAAVDITSCGQTVPPREIGVLTGDLVCNPGETGVTLTLDSTLDLNGYDIVAPDGWAVWCEPSHRCAIIGHGGEIRDAEAGVYIQNRVQLTLTDITIRNCQTGVLAEDWNNGRSGSKARMTDVYVTGSSAGAIVVGRVAAENVSVIDNPGSGLHTSTIGKIKAKGLTVTGNATSALCEVVGCEGIEAGTIIGRDVVVTGNAGAGVKGKFVRLTDSTVTGNLRAGSPVDIVAYREPLLRRVTCNRSVVASDPLTEWGVCQLDGTF